MGTAIQAAVMLPVMFGFVAFSIDIGFVRGSRLHLQDIADASALAGIPKLGNAQNVRTSVQTIASANRVAGASITIPDTDIKIGTWNGTTWTDDANGSYVKVVAKRPAHPLYFTSFLGYSSIDLTATAIAVKVAGTTDVPCGMFADDGFELNGSGVVHGYNSATGAVTTPSLCTNATNITTQGNYWDQGDAHPAPGGTVSRTGSSRIDGSRTPMDHTVTLPRSTVPATYRAWPDYHITGSESITLTSGAPYYINGDLSVQGTINIASGPIVIYMKNGDADINGQGFVNGTGDPSMLTIHFIGNKSFHNNGGSVFYGVIDAPDAEVELNGNADVYGAVIGGYIHHNGNFDLYLDETLATMATTSGGSGHHGKLVY